jgi:serine O-acetyltransferase
MSPKKVEIERDIGVVIDIESLSGLLLSDLERYFFYNGQEGRIPRKRDLWRNFLVPRCAPVALYRVAHRLHLSGLKGLSKFVTWINFYLHGVEISARCKIGAHFYMPHASGAVIGATAIGRYAVIYHQATLGAKTVAFGDEGRPIVGDYVMVGSGAKVLGGITIGDGCRIGANSVVTESLPPNVLAVGVPAKFSII